MFRKQYCAGICSVRCLENRKRNFAEVDGGVIETNSKRGGIASHSREANCLNKIAT
jgi:hypothetical protein